MKSSSMNVPGTDSPVVVRASAAEDRPSIQGIFDYEAPRMVKGPIALIGDAAFVVRPHTAMGVSKAAGDVMALQRHLAAEDGLDRALAAFERERTLSAARFPPMAAVSELRPSERRARFRCVNA